MLLAFAAILYLPPETFPPYVLAFLLGFGSGAAMIPYAMIKELNPDRAKGSATGAMNFLVFAISALAGPTVGWWLQDLAGGQALTPQVFVEALSPLAVGIFVAAIVALFLKETGAAAHKEQ